MSEKDVIRLIEANKMLMEVVDNLYRRLSQYEAVEETEATGDLDKMQKVANIMMDYE